VVQCNRRRPRVRVSTGGRDVVSHAGARLVADVADGRRSV
jgi:hypothetical protein